MIRDTSKYMISQDTKTPLMDILRISRVLDALDDTGLPEFDEKYMLWIFYRFAIEEEPYLVEDDASPKFIKWFNEENIDTYIQQMSDEEFQDFEKIWPDKR